MKKVIIFLIFLLSFLSANELEQILKSNVIKIGINNNTAPFSTINSQDELVGFEISLAKQIAKHISPTLKIDFIHLEKNDRILALQENRVDLVISSLSISKQRAKQINFSSPYFYINTAVLSKRIDLFTSLKSLEGKKIALIKDTLTHKKLANKFDLVFCDNTKACFSMLQNSLADVFVSDDLILYAYEVQNSDYEVAIKRIGSGDFLAIGLNKNDVNLLNKVEEILVFLSKNHILKEIYNETIAPYFDNKLDSSRFLLDEIFTFN